ncbi:DUF378 domain-containing protein [bacterium]|nr:DUF378 domain-containing protein [bacterium]
MYILRIIAYTLVIIGALNWAMVGMFGYDLVASLFGEMSVITRTIYSLVGLSAITLLFIGREEMFSKNCVCRCE